MLNYYLTNNHGNVGTQQLLPGMSVPFAAWCHKLPLNHMHQIVSLVTLPYMHSLYLSSQSVILTCCALAFQWISVAAQHPGHILPSCPLLLKMWNSWAAPMLRNGLSSLLLSVWSTQWLLASVYLIMAFRLNGASHDSTRAFGAYELVARFSYPFQYEVFCHLCGGTHAMCNDPQTKPRVAAC